MAGDPGIGKSALIAAGLDVPERQGCQVFCAAAYEQSPVFPLDVLLEAFGGGTDSPFAEVAEPDPDSVRAARAEIVGLLHGEQAELVTPRDAVPAAAERIVVLVHRLCTDSPVILVLDDAQWADEASLGVLLRLAGALRQIPLLMVVAVRPVPTRPEVEALREALASAGASAIGLGPLSHIEAAEMVRQIAGAPPGPALARQLAAAGGNPLYLRELIEALVRERLHLDASTAELRGDAAGLPRTLTTAIGRRLGFLSQPALSVLRMAAVLGQVFSAAELSTVTGQHASEFADVMAEAVSAGVLAGYAPGTLAFRHGLVHQTLYQGMPASLRAALHRQAAMSLAGAGAEPGRVAAQLLAGPPEADPWMIDWIAGAAPMLSHSAPRVAADLLERARDGLGWQDPRRERLDAHLAMARLMIGNNEQVLLLAQPILESARDPAMAGRAAWMLAYALPRLGQHEQAIEVTDRALARDGLPPVWSARLRARRATSLFAVGRYDAARAEAERAEAEGTQAGDRLSVGYALYTLTRLDIVSQGGTLTAAKDAIERALAVLRDEPQATDLLLQLRANLGLTLVGLGRPTAADREFAQAVALVERGTPPRQAYVRAYSALAAFTRGKWDDALAELDAAAQLTPDATYRQYLAGVAAQVAIHRDERVAADAYLHGAGDIQLTSGEVRIEVEFLLVAWALAAERDADPAEALTRLLAIFDPGATHEFPRLGMASTEWMPDVVRLALAVGEPEVAAAAAKACATEAGSQARPPVTAAAQHCQGLVDTDPDAVRAAALLFQSCGYQLSSAQAQENAAVLYAEQGDAKAALTAHLRAVRIYSDLGAVWDIRRADARLRQHGIRRGSRSIRRRPATGWEALTPTELKIVHLVAAGKSNPDIAGQMLLSRYTVQTHVSHILTKLNAKSRVEIARAAARHLQLSPHGAAP